MINIGSYTTFQTESYANNFIDITSDKEIESFIKSLENNKDFFCFGGGSNLLFGKSLYEDKLFIRNNYRGIEHLGDNVFKVKAGENLTLFVNYLNKLGISTFNPLFGLPGTVGGAVVGNAGCFGIEIGNFIKSVTYIENGDYITTDNYVCTYRDSNLKGRNILLVEMIFNIPQSAKNLETGAYYNDRRKKNQEYGKTCGSYFKNVKLKLDNGKLFRGKNELNNQILEIIKTQDPENKITSQNFGIDKFELTVPAGWLIDKVGLRGFEYNGVQVSNKHANFIMNYTNKDPNTILQLANILKEKVFEKFGLLLEEEVIII